MRVVERAFRGHPSGAAVVVDVRTGRVRALYSKPSYDLERDERATHARARAPSSTSSPFRPLIDKTVYETYFPGSTFKPISALAALQDDILTPRLARHVRGLLPARQPTLPLRPRARRGRHAQGARAVVQRLLLSARRAGGHRSASAELSRDFGLGAVTGIGINTEAEGFVPTRDWYLKTHGDRYRVGYTLNDAIGQGNTRVTLIQLAMVVRGDRQRRHAVRAAARAGGRGARGRHDRRVPAARAARRSASTRSTSLYVIDGMYGAVNDPNGTAYEARIEGGVPIAGKTGTAQVTRGRLPGGDADVPNAWYYRRSHAWFAGFAPADEPELAIVVLVEHGGHGGKYAAPIAMRVLQEALAPSAATRTAAAAASAANHAAAALRPHTSRRAGKTDVHEVPAMMLNRGVRDSFDWPLFVMVAAIALIGVVNLYSATQRDARAAARHLHPADLLAHARGGRRGARGVDRLPPLRALRLGRVRRRGSCCSRWCSCSGAKCAARSAGSRSAASRCSRAS